MNQVAPAFVHALSAFRIFADIIHETVGQRSVRARKDAEAIAPVVVPVVWYCIQVDLTSQPYRYYSCGDPTEYLDLLVRVDLAYVYSVACCIARMIAAVPCCT